MTDGATTARTRNGEDPADDPRDGGHAGGEASAGEDALCDVHVVHEEAVRAALETRSEEEDLTYLADTFQILASPTRLRIVEALAERELCVCDLAAVVGSSPSAVSHHLRQLRQMKIVRYRKEGRMAYYRLDDDHITRLFTTGLEHVRE